jgi:hypothetical protein
MQNESPKKPRSDQITTHKVIKEKKKKKQANIDTIVSNQMKRTRNERNNKQGSTHPRHLIKRQIKEK